jgi:predicted regulator of Ras-like GTPase activity (Roadblock/LC7/MglB family)
VPPDTLLVPVEELAAAWPESVKQELERLGCAQAECALPINEITEPLKAGRIAVRLERLLGWVVPKPSGRCAAQLGDTVLELPLQTVVPRYFARYKLPPKPKKIVPSDSVPDLFTKEGRLNKAPQAQPGGPAPLAQHAPDSAEPDGRAQPGALIFSLRELSAQWPESVKQELARFNLEEAQVHVPLDVAEKHLRQGKVEFSWKELCAWIKNCPQSVPSQLTAELRVELPLPVVAPRFIKVRPPPTPPTPAEVAPDIPDLFGPGKPLSGVSASQPREVKTSVVSRSAAPSSTPARAPELPGSAAGAAPQPAKKLPKDIAELFGEPDKSVWTPNELVQKTACLPGVAGALIALQDGLLVAECMPPNWKPETIAAFLPQIFGRMNQYARELAMGELRSLTFTVEGGSLQIFAAGIIYFAALGKPGVPLPQLELNLIATELSRHTK